MLLLAAASCAAFSVLGRRAFADRDPLAVLAGSALWGAVFLAPPAAAEAVVDGVGRPSPGSVLLLLYLGLGCSALAFGCSAYGLRHLTATKNAVVGAVELPIGLAAAALLLGEILGPMHLTGGALLLAGTALALGQDAARRVPTLSGAADVSRTRRRPSATARSRFLKVARADAEPFYRVAKALNIGTNRRRPLAEA